MGSTKLTQEVRLRGLKLFDYPLAPNPIIKGLTLPHRGAGAPSYYVHSIRLS